MDKKIRYQVIVEEWDAESFSWRFKKRLTFQEATKDIAKEIVEHG